MGPRTGEGVGETPKEVYVNEFLLRKIAEIISSKGFTPHELELNKKKEKTHKDGVVTSVTIPAVFNENKKAIGRLKVGQNLLFYNSRNKNELFSYFLQFSERNWGDGETTEHIVISKIPSPSLFRNKQEWLDKGIRLAIYPAVSTEELQDEDEEGSLVLPTLVIMLEGRSFHLAVAGGEDKILKKIEQALIS